MIDVESLKRDLTRAEEEAGVALFELITGLGGEYRDVDGNLTEAGMIAEGILGSIRQVQDALREAEAKPPLR